jgi:hypothetical protein
MKTQICISTWFSLYIEGKCMVVVLLLYYLLLSLVSELRKMMENRDKKWQTTKKLRKIVLQNVRVEQRMKRKSVNCDKRVQTTNERILYLRRKLVSMSALIKCKLQRWRSRCGRNLRRKTIALFFSRSHMKFHRLIAYRQKQSSKLALRPVITSIIVKFKTKNSFEFHMFSFNINIGSSFLEQSSSTNIFVWIV